MVFSTNKVIKYLILSDLAFWTGWGLINPVFAIFIVERIEGGTVLVAGIASAVFWVVRSLVRVPFGLLVDRLPTEKDDYFFLVIGLFIASIIPFGFILAETPWHIYFLQALHGVALAMALSGWTAIFTHHIDKGKESTEWGLDATSIGLGVGLASAVGGWAITRFGFNNVFAAVGLFGLLGVALLLVLYKEMKTFFKEDSVKALSEKSAMLRYKKDHKFQG